MKKSSSMYRQIKKAQCEMKKWPKEWLLGIVITPIGGLNP